MMNFLLLPILSMLICSLQSTDAIAVMSVDFGSEWMKIAIVKPGVPMEIALNKETKRKTEVAVSFAGGERHFGSAAMTKGVRLPKSTFRYLQDLLAKSLDNPLVQQYKKRFPYHNIKEDPDTGTIVFVNEEMGFSYSPEELLAMVLNHSKTLAEEHAQQPIDTCVITVPVYFNQAERKALLYSAKLAGLSIAQLMDENTAAALNYGVFRRHDINSSASYMMLYDMGATSTVASVIAYQVMKVNGITDPQLSVKGVGFDRSLGGLEMEFRFRDHLVKLFNEKKKTKMDVTKNPRSMAKLLKEAKRVMKVLSANVDHIAQIEGLIDEEDFRAKVTRKDFETICSDLWERVPTPMAEALKSADLTMNSISQILLVGGGTRVPKVQQILMKSSGKPELGKSINADEAAALGASYQAAALSNAFRVKTFHVKGGAVYPIEVDFDRHSRHENGTAQTKHVKKTLFQRTNPYPQRKVITFNRFYDNFNFSVSYGDLKFFNDEDKRVFGNRLLSQVKIKGVAAIHEKYEKDNSSESKGVKAHFRMDESGILNLESVEAVFEVNKTIEENVTIANASDEESTLQKIKDGLSSFFGGGSSENDTDETTSGNKEKSAANVTKEDSKPLNGTAKTKVEDTDKVPKNETKTVSKNIKMKKSEELEMDISVLDHVEPPVEHEEKSVEKLKYLADKDAYKLARETAMNKLESYIYDKRDKLYLEEYEEALTDEEKEKISPALDEALEWMEDLEGEPVAEVYDEKRTALKDLARPWLLRVKTRKEAVPALEELESLFNYTFHFMNAVVALPAEAQIYTEVEIKTLFDLYNSTVSWKNDTVTQEKALKPYEDAILKADDIRRKSYELNREVQYMYNKAKTAKPKKSKYDENKNSSSNATKEEEPINVDRDEKAKQSSSETKAEDAKEGAKAEMEDKEDNNAQPESSPKAEENDATTDETESQEEVPPTEETSERTTKESEQSETTTKKTTTTEKHEDNDKEEL